MASTASSNSVDCGFSCIVYLFLWIVVGGIRSMYSVDKGYYRLSGQRISGWFREGLRRVVVYHVPRGARHKIPRQTSDRHRSPLIHIGLYPLAELKLETVNEALLLHLGEARAQPSDDISPGSIFEEWSYDGGRWSRSIGLVGGARFVTKPIDIGEFPLDYLTEEDRKRVAEQPNLISLQPSISTCCKSPFESIKEKSL